MTQGTLLMGALRRNHVCSMRSNPLRSTNGSPKLQLHGFEENMARIRAPKGSNVVGPFEDRPKYGEMVFLGTLLLVALRPKAKSQKPTAKSQALHQRISGQDLRSRLRGELERRQLAALVARRGPFGASEPLGSKMFA